MSLAVPHEPPAIRFSGFRRGKFLRRAIEHRVDILPCAAGTVDDAIDMIRLDGLRECPARRVAPGIHRIGRRANGMRIRIPSVRTGKPPRFGREPEAGGLFPGWPDVRRRLARSTCSSGLFGPPFVAVSQPLPLDAAREPGHDPRDGVPDRVGLPPSALTQ